MKNKNVKLTVTMEDKVAYLDNRHSQIRAFESSSNYNPNFAAQGELDILVKQVRKAEESIRNQATKIREESEKYNNESWVVTLQITYKKYLVNLLQLENNIEAYKRLKDLRPDLELKFKTAAEFAKQQAAYDEKNKAKASALIKSAEMIAIEEGKVEDMLKVKSLKDMTSKEREIFLAS